MAEETTSGSLTYRRELRRLDRRHGMQDGRKRMPGMTEVTRLRRMNQRVTSGYTQVLVSEFFQHATRIHTAFLAATAGRRAGIAKLEMQVEALAHQVEVVASRLTKAERPLTPEELLPRNPDEPKRSPDELRQRREVMRRWRIAQATAALDVKKAELLGVREAKVNAERELDALLEQARKKVRQLGELYAVRISHYWDGVLRTHRDSSHIAAYLAAPRIPMPPWVGGEPTAELDSAEPEPEPEQDGPEADQSEEEKTS